MTDFEKRVRQAETRPGPHEDLPYWPGFPLTDPTTTHPLDRRQWGRAEYVLMAAIAMLPFAIWLLFPILVKFVP